jgi:hypothetical protein
MPMIMLGRTRFEWSGLVVSLVLAMGGVGIALGNLTADRTGARALERSEPGVPLGVPALADRIAAVDRALARKDTSAAVYAWSDAYTLALGARRWQAMVEVGDAAVRIHALAGHASAYLLGFRAEARQAYLRALFLARHDRSAEGIERVAQAFAALGDADMAAQVRTIVVAR